LETPGPPGPPSTNFIQQKKRKWEKVQTQNVSSQQNLKSENVAENISNAFKSFSDKKYETRKKWVGLLNQGSTCYLNSLIQALMMTPEVRQKLYQWTYDPKIHGE